jgi:glycosyltransferase involved in cell wall biosynthesis
VLSEAIAAGVPVLASRIPGSVGILGADYPGFFPAGDTEALAALLSRAEGDAGFYAALRRWCRRLKPLVRPARERESWRRLLREFEARPE